MIHKYCATLAIFCSVGALSAGLGWADVRSVIPVYELDAEVESIDIDLGVARIPSPTQMSVDTQLFDLLEHLKYEVRHLTGKVERLEYELNQLKSNQKDHYTDLNRRVNILGQRHDEANKNNPVLMAAGGVQTTVDTQLVNPTTHAVPNVSAIGLSAQKNNAEAEKNAYKSAFSLIKDRQYKQAKQALQDLINDFPEGIYTANSYYWLGEVFLVQAEYSQAITAFEQVTTGFSKHRKVPDALYKIGVAYDKMGQQSKAKTYFQQVISNYPASSSARLSLNFLN